MEEFDWDFCDVGFKGRSWIPDEFSMVIVVVHGIGEHMGRYADFAGVFNRAGYAVIGIDHYGHGKSEGKRGASKGIDFTFNYIESFLTDVLVTYKKQIILYGHSMGGGLVTGLVLKRLQGISGVVISSPALAIPGISRVKKAFLKYLDSLVPDLTINQGLDLNMLSHNKQVIEAFKNDSLNHHKMSIRLAWDMIANGEWCLQNADRLKVKALLLHGSNDAFTSVIGSRQFAIRSAPDLLTYKEWEGCYHELHNEPQKEQLFVLLLEWMRTLSYFAEKQMKEDF